MIDKQFAPKMKCPKCGKRKVYFKIEATQTEIPTTNSSKLQRKNKVYNATTKIIYHCAACGHEWEG